MVAPLVLTSDCTKPGRSFAVTSCAGFGGSSGKDMGLMATVWPDSLFPTKLAPAIAALAARTPFFKNARRFSAWLIAFILFSLSFILYPCSKSDECGLRGDGRRAQYILFSQSRRVRGRPTCHPSSRSPLQVRTV